jgi:hypothetical protein
VSICSPNSVAAERASRVVVGTSYASITGMRAAWIVVIAVLVLAILVALGCGKSGERRASDVYAPAPIAAPSAIGGGPPVALDAPDAALTPRYELDANAVLAEPVTNPASEKGDGQADGPSGGTYGASSDDRSPGAAYEREGRAGVAQPTTAPGP